MRGKRTQLRRATHDDVDRLVAWHGDPDVARYWDDESFTRDEMRARLDRDDADACRGVGVPQATATLVGAPDMCGRAKGGRPQRARVARIREPESGAQRSGARRRKHSVEVSRGNPPGEDHLAEWVLMEYRLQR